MCVCVCVCVGGGESYLLHERSVCLADVCVCVLGGESYLLHELSVCLADVCWGGGGPLFANEGLSLQLFNRQVLSGVSSNLSFETKNVLRAPRTREINTNCISLH